MEEFRAPNINYSRGTEFSDLVSSRGTEAEVGREPQALVMTEEELKPTRNCWQKTKMFL